MIRLRGFTREAHIFAGLARNTLEIKDYAQRYTRDAKNSSTLDTEFGVITQYIAATGN